jgi:hypothetical protein
MRGPRSATVATSATSFAVTTWTSEPTQYPSGLNPTLDAIPGLVKGCSAGCGAPTPGPPRTRGESPFPAPVFRYLRAADRSSIAGFPRLPEAPRPP